MATSSALAGYDIVLSISNEAINAQFEALYSKELPKKLRPPQLEVGDKVATTAPSYFINHEFKVLVKEDDVEDEKELQGINGHIKCPRVTIHPSKRGVAVVTLTFQRDERVQDEDLKDSVLQYPHTEKRLVTIRRLNINDWTFSWECNIATQDIVNVMEDLVGPAEDQEAQIQLPSETIEKLKSRFETNTTPVNTDTDTSESVNSNIFTAASIFCMMESVQMSNSFSIQPPEGYVWPKELSKGTNHLQKKTAIAMVQTLIVQYFQEMKDAARQGGKDSSHLPTPNNPFVLGYSIRQDVPKLKDLNKDVDTTKTPRYFLPRRVDCTTTPSPGNAYTDGTLDFCMLTHREDESCYTVSIDVDMVKFPETLFQKLSIGGGVNTLRGGRAGHDGIMGFSSEIFCKRWLSEAIAQPFVADPNKYGDALEPTHPGIKSRGKSYTKKPLSETNAPKAMEGIEYSGWSQATLKDNLGVKRTYSGLSKVTLEYASDFSSYTPEQRQQTDLRRNLYLNLRVWNQFDIEALQQKSSFLGMIFGEDGKAEYTSMIKAFYRANFKIGYTLSPGQGGIWSMTKDNDRTTFPGTSAKAKVVDCTDVNFLTKPFWETFSEKDDGFNLYLVKCEAMKHIDMPNWLEDIANDWCGNQNLGIQKAVDSVMDSIRNVVIMPAGNVLQFKGLDCDDQGNVYSTVDYQTLSPKHGKPKVVS